MIKFFKQIRKKWKNYWENIQKEIEEAEKKKEEKKRLLRIRIVAYKMGTKSALRPKEVFWYITFPKVLKFSMLGTKYSIIAILIIAGIIGGVLIFLGSTIYAVFLYIALPIIIISIIF